MTNIRSGLALALALALASAGWAQWAGQSGAVKPGDPIAYAGQAIPATLFKRTRRDDVHGATRVVVPFFQVQFVTESKVSSNRQFASLSQDYALGGLSDADMQAIVDRLYDKFVADLAAQGLTVVPLAEARAQSPALAKLLAAAKPAPFKGKTGDGTTSTIVSAHGTPIYFHIGDPKMGSMANIGSRAYWDQPQAATELHAALIGVRLGVDFVEQKSSDKRGLLGMRSQTAKVESKVNLTIEPVTTHLWIQAPDKTPSIVGQPIEPVRYYLTSPLILPDDSLGTARDTTTAGGKRGDIAATAIGALFGGSTNNRNKSFTVTVDPERFKTDVGGAMGAVDATLAQQVKADLRGS